MRGAMSTTVEPAPRIERARFRRRSRSWQYAAAIFVILAAAVVGQGSIRTPTGPAAGAEFHVPWTYLDEPTNYRAAGLPIRVGTYNIHGGKGLDGQRDLDRIAKCLDRMYFVGLNEVHGADDRAGRDQAEQLGRRLRMAWLFTPTERRWWHEHFGNGALCDDQVKSWQRIPLDTAGSSTGRNALLVTLYGTDRHRPISALVTHVDRSDPQRSAQLRTVIDLFLSLTPPAILLGDLNTTSADPLIQQLLATPGTVDALAGTTADQGRIDWIVSRGLKCTDRGMTPVGPSDHPCFWAEFVLPNEEPAEFMLSTEKSAARTAK